jgi:enoyl-CoA hydratase/carnithine racemase
VAVLHTDPAGLRELLAPPQIDEQLSAAHGTSALVVELDGGPLDGGPLDGSADRLLALPCVTIGVPAERDAPFDVVLGPDDHDLLGPLVEAIEAHPIAAAALAILLRGSEQRSTDEGLAAESAVYSLLQAGPEFAAWRASRPARPVPDEPGPTVRLERRDDALHITLDRPSRHNAFSRRLRDELTDALHLAAADPSVRRVVLAGAGPSFCSGGDLDEFGTFPDPATAHLIRLTRSAARVLATIATRTEARLHGACMGAGIELPAFAGRVVADPGAVIALPELSLGLVPGAGGTVSLPRRIGRQRTAVVALTGMRLDATTALRWGLVDAIEPVDGG